MFDIKLQSEYDDLYKYKDYYENIYYYRKGKLTLHNPYGPAFISSDGNKEYYIENKLHRLDGPARVWVDNYEEYWINNELLTKEKFDVHPERLKYLGKENLICLG